VRFLVSSLLFATACASPVASDIHTVQQPILAGEVSTASDDATVEIRLKGERDCTGIAVSPKLVLTARHCLLRGLVDGEDSIIKDCPSTADLVAREDLSIVVGSDSDFPRQTLTVSRIFADEIVGCGTDLAALELAVPIDASIKLPALRLDTPVINQESVFTVGWGVTKLPRTNTPDVYPTQRQRSSGAVLSATGAVENFPLPSKGVFAASVIACKGDSGGPIFDASGTLLGIVFDGPPNTCASLTYGVSLEYNRDRIERWFRAVGRMPTREGRQSPSELYGTCLQNRECHSNLCANVAGSGVCTQTCTKDVECTEGSSCLATRQEARVCLPKQALPVRPSCTISQPTGDGHLTPLLLTLGIALCAYRRRLDTQARRSC
jgi:Trypsin